MAISFAAIELGWTVVGHHSHQLNLGLALNSQSVSPPSDTGDVLSGDDAREDNSIAEVDQGIAESSPHSIFFQSCYSRLAPSYIVSVPFLEEIAEFLSRPRLLSIVDSLRLYD